MLIIKANFFIVRNEGFKGSELLYFDQSIRLRKNVLKSNATKYAQKNVFDNMPFLNVWLMALEKSLRVDPLTGFQYKELHLSSVQ